LKTTTIPLPSTNVRIPDHRMTGSSLNRSQFNGNLVPLVSEVISYGLAGPQRTSQPTNVSVILDKIESIQNGLIQDNMVSLLGTPERVILVKDDKLSIYVWAGNYISSQTSVILGVRFYRDSAEIDLSELLCNITLSPASGGGAVKTVPFKNPVKKCNVYFGQRLSRNCHGGFILEGTVLAPLSGVEYHEVEIQAVAAFSGQELRDEKSVTYEFAAAIYKSNNSEARLHQQGQFYGDYKGSAVLESGRAVVIAAPGSWGYHGDSWQGMNDPDQKQAAYWVPLNILLTAGAAPPANIKISAESGKFVDPSALSITAKYPDGKTKNIKTGVAFPFAPEMELTITFLGTSATSLVIYS